MSSDTLAHVAFLKRAKNRKRIFLAIDTSNMPSEIAEQVFGNRSGTPLSITSRALAELRDRGLIKILNPDEKTGRMYNYTSKGLRVKEELARYDARR